MINWSWRTWAAALIVPCCTLVSSAANPREPNAREVTTAAMLARTSAWLDRALANMDQALSAPSRSPRAVSDSELAVAIVRSGGGERLSDRERKLLLRVLDTAPPSKPAHVSPANWEFLAQLNRAAVLAALGERDAAASLLRRLETQTHEDRLLLPFLTPSCYLALGWTNLGNRDKVLELIAVEPSLDPDVAYDLAIVAFHDNGFAAQCGEMIRRRFERVQAVVDQEERAWRLAALADAQRRVEDFAGARKSIELMPLNHQRSDALCRLARARAEDGDSASAANDLLDAAAVAQRLPERAADECAGVARVACELNLPDAAATALAAAERAAGDEGFAENSFCADIAYSAAAIGDRALFQRAIRHAVNIADDTDNAPDQARSWLLIAAAHARLGDRAASQQALDRSLANMREGDYAASDEFTGLCRAWVQAGHSDVALDIAAPLLTEPQDLSFIHEAIAEHETRAGRFDAAWAATDHVTVSPTAQLAARCRVLLAEALSGADARVAARIASLDDPRDRALLCLAVAEKLSNHAPRGPLRVLIRE